MVMENNKAQQASSVRGLAPNNFAIRMMRADPEIECEKEIRKIKAAIIYAIAVFRFKNNSEKRKLHQQHKHDNVCKSCC